MIDPVYRDLNRHLAEMDLKEQLAEYVAEYGDPCSGCEHRCRSCKINGYQWLVKSLLADRTDEELDEIEMERAHEEMEAA